MSPALAGRFFTTESPGKTWLVCLFCKIFKPFAYFSIVFDYFAFFIFLSSLLIQEI